VLDEASRQKKKVGYSGGRTKTGREGLLARGAESAADQLNSAEQSPGPGESNWYRSGEENNLRTVEGKKNHGFKKRNQKKLA